MKEDVVKLDVEQDDLKVKKAWEIAIGPAKTYAPASLYIPLHPCFVDGGS